MEQKVLEQKVLLEMKNICKTFPGVKALGNVDFSVREGEIMALMGENGAGKSTLIKIITGLYSKDSGEIWFNGGKSILTTHLKRRTWASAPYFRS
jgi:ABC-type sugar transport system ATPase subunit